VSKEESIEGFRPEDCKDANEDIALLVCSSGSTGKAASFPTKQLRFFKRQEQVPMPGKKILLIKDSLH